MNNRRGLSPHPGWHQRPGLYGSSGSGGSNLIAPWRGCAIAQRAGIRGTAARDAPRCHSEGEARGIALVPTEGRSTGMTAIPHFVRNDNSTGMTAIPHFVRNDKRWRPERPFPLVPNPWHEEASWPGADRLHPPDPVNPYTLRSMPEGARTLVGSTANRTCDGCLRPPR